MNLDTTKYCNQRSLVCDKIKKVIEYAVFGKTTLSGFDKCRKVYAEIDTLYRKKNKINEAEQKYRMRVKKANCLLIYDNKGNSSYDNA